MTAMGSERRSTGREAIHKSLVTDATVTLRDGAAFQVINSFGVRGLRHGAIGAPPYGAAFSASGSIQVFWKNGSCGPYSRNSNSNLRPAAVWTQLAALPAGASGPK